MVLAGRIYSIPLSFRSSTLVVHVLTFPLHVPSPLSAPTHYSLPSVSSLAHPSAHLLCHRKFYVIHTGSFLFFFFYVALNSEGDEIERWLMWRENELICILQRRHSNCHPTLLFLVVFCYSLSRSHISRAMRLTCAAGQDCGLTFSFSGPISRPPCHSPLLSLLRTLHLTLLPPNLCRQY